MSRWCLLALLIAAPAHAQDKTVVRFEVPAKAAPKPALKYQLLPEVRELESGTALQHYMKCFMAQNQFYHSKEAIEQRGRWLELPLKDLPLDKLRNYGGNTLRYADAAARMERIEWQILADMRRNGVNTVLPEIQKLRDLASALKVRLRGEIAEGRFDDAVGTVKTLFQLGRHLGEHPTLIGNLVGMAIVSLTIPCLEEMIQQPGCPNLYWALADLPQPLVSIRAGAQGDRMMVKIELNRIDRIAPATNGEVEKAVAHVEKVMQADQNKAVDLMTGLLERTAKADEVKAARERVIEFGVARAAAAKMPPLQILLLDDIFATEARSDEELKWLSQPIWRAEPRYAALAVRKGALMDLLPRVSKVHRAQGRVEQRLKLLQVSEAVRLHAAANNGAVPAKLDDVDFPLPIDPFTGKAFRYAVADGVATIRGTPPRSEEKTAAFNFEYEVKIVK